MQLIPVNDTNTTKEFLKVPILINRGNPNWVRPIDDDINKIFDPKRNKLFRHGEAARWILKNDSGNLIGRVAAFLDKKKAFGEDQPTGGMGFFDCINDQTAANTLFDVCKNWLAERQMEAMDGPINFGERNEWWGLLVEGFNMPTYNMNYNPKYYEQLFENYGFQLYFNQYVYNYHVSDPIPEKYRDRAERIARNPQYTFKHLNKKYIDKYTEDFRNIYNEAWSKFYNVPPMEVHQSKALMKVIKPILEEELMWFGYYDKKPVAFFLMLPDINPIINHLNGKLDLIGKLKFVYYRWSGKTRRMIGVLFGVTPDHQAKGVEGAIVMASAKVIQPMKKYDELEMNWIGDFNPKMIHLVDTVGGKLVRRYITYRKLFDASKPFNRHPIMNK